MPLPLVGTKASTVVVNRAPANFSLLLLVPCTDTQTDKQSGKAAVAPPQMQLLHQA